MLYLKNYCYIQGHLDILLLYSMNFYFFCFIRSIIHSELIFVKRVEYVSTFFVLYMYVPLSQNYLLKRLFFLYYIAFTFVKFPLTMSESRLFMSDFLQPHGL